MGMHQPAPRAPKRACEIQSGLCSLPSRRVLS
jgi:hypothetical protein